MRTDLILVYLVKVNDPIFDGFELDGVGIEGNTVDEGVYVGGTGLLDFEGITTVLINEVVIVNGGADAEAVKLAERRGAILMERALAVSWIVDVSVRNSTVVDAVSAMKDFLCRLAPNLFTELYVVGTLLGSAIQSRGYFNMGLYAHHPGSAESTGGTSSSGRGGWVVTCDVSLALTPTQIC